MQFKPVPRPPTDRDPIATVEAVRTAVPPEPDPAIDCCARVTAETAVESRDAAADWLIFLRALELVVDDPDGYRRAAVDGEPDAKALGAAFRRRVLGADAVLEAVAAAAEPITPAEAYAELERGDAIPRSARRRHGDELDARWTARIERLLDWAVAFDLVERVGDGYRSAEP